jgi:alanine racemase
MGRVGVSPSEAVGFIKELIRFPKIELEGLMTHFSVADTSDDLTYTYKQLERFVTVKRELEKEGIHPKWFHAANSPGLLFVPESHLDLVRPGLLIYGISPTPTQSKITLTPALSLHARITQVKNVGASEDISYGRTFTTKRKSRLGIVPLGHGDGFSRRHSNRARVIVNGEYAPILGTVCMDQFVVDLTDLARVELGDEVVLIGRQGNLEISAWDLAKTMDSIPYEVVVTLGARIPRRYISS